MFNIYTKNNSHNGAPIAPSAPPAAGGSAKKPAYESYNDPTGELTAQKLKFGVWVAEHRLRLYRAAVGALIGFNVLTWGYVLLYLGYYLIFGIAEDRAISQSLSRTYDYTSARAHFAPAPLQIIATDVYQGGVGKYDAVSETVNPNLNWRAEFDYYFIVDGAATGRGHAVLLPGDTRPIAILGIESESYPGGAEVILENIVWKRVSAHTITNAAVWQAERLNFKMTDFKFTRAQSDDTTHGHAIEFKLANDSAYSYARPQFYASLLYGGAPVGIMAFTLDNFRAGETRAVDLRSYVAGLAVTAVEIYPAINVYDRSVFLAPYQ